MKKTKKVVVREYTTRCLNFCFIILFRSHAKKYTFTFYDGCTNESYFSNMYHLIFQSFMILYPNIMWTKSRRQIANIDDYVIISTIIIGFKDDHDFFFWSIEFTLIMM